MNEKLCETKMKNKYSIKRKRARIIILEPTHARACSPAPRKATLTAKSRAECTTSLVGCANQSPASSTISTVTVAIGGSRSLRHAESAATRYFQANILMFAGSSRLIDVLPLCAAPG